MINKERLKNTFLKIVQLDSGSSEEGRLNNVPSTSCQLDAACVLADVLKDIGLNDVNIDQYGVLTATLEGNIESSTTIGLIAHIDTSDAVENKNVKPLVHNYTSGDIELKNGVKIKSAELEKYKNNTIITSDGTTLLGADDKAGVAEIIEALYVFKENPDLRRLKIRVAFTPDEEIGCGTEKFDVKSFGADYAYTLDGDSPNAIDTETFNAYNPEIIIEGAACHTGYAYQKMVNSISVAMDIISQLPKDEAPETTKDRQGFYHVNSICGEVSKTTIKLIVRDFDAAKEEERIEFLKDLVDKTKAKYGVRIDFIENKRYQNMKTELDKHPEVIENAKTGIGKSNLTPEEAFIRGGTDGAELTCKGLPCPNLGCGAENYHSLNEFVSLETMTKSTENIINIMQTWAENL